ncbi:MAG: hypothetical protein LPJ89_03570, partial [Hymenobacteraceae bacterium]|nr:hypothetical protein [Hymenobacteraceae bacterium]MDX5395092.1 hypothetical protein [Hymenobacteraceae bacterium]MDX5442842.1 hypothetical protein [Hymenobacteraceae bacterium]MDX5511130.1 hypothetical protein [Hymenobacteraceae bacterium]
MRSLFSILVILFFIDNAYCQASTMLCDNGHKYKEFVTYLNKNGMNIENTSKNITCIFFNNLNDSLSNTGAGFYSLKSSEIHA